ncbi:MAG: DUF4120 domain-containing protein [Muribaculaceae bacterium]|nr:DUF4120 domain-containing protein [Muribaculaceae bacterium]
MKERTMLKLTASGDYMILCTVSHRYGKSGQFYIPMEKLTELEQKGYVTSMDAPSFLQLRVCKGTGDFQKLEVRFTWLSSAGNDRVIGRTEHFCLDYAAFRASLKDLLGQENGDRRLLSLQKNNAPRICFNSRKNLKQVVQNHSIRKKLGRFLMGHFRWKDAACIHISDDFVPYSFFFTEETAQGRGLCGGIILHGQEDMSKAYYGLHT